MRGQRTALGLYAAEIQPGVTCTVSHYTRELCLPRELWINHPDFWRVDGLAVGPSRRLELGKPIRIGDDGYPLEDMARWPIQDAFVLPAETSIYLTVTALCDTPQTIQALVWAILG